MFYLKLFSILISTYLIYRGIQYLLGLKKSLKFLLANHKHRQNFNDNCPFLVILLPLLREQSIIRKMINYFSNIPYKQNKIAIVLITTEKELYEKTKNRAKINTLYSDIKNLSLPKKYIIEKYLGVLSKEQIKRLTKPGIRKKLTINDLTKLYNEYPTTIDLVKRLIPQKNQQIGSKLFFHAHYPNKKGVMAHQLNYAVQNLKRIIDRKVNAHNTVIGVYNADSKPNRLTFETLCKEAQFIKQKHGSYPEVLQQISCYCGNYKDYSNSIAGFLLKASAIIQTRWALGFEIPMLLRQSRYWLNRKHRELTLLDKIFEPAAYCVGHGLFIRMDILTKIGLFPTETSAEDLPLGFYLCLNNYPIRPLPVLENVENPDSLSMLLTQKSVWFWGMIDYLEYVTFSKKKVRKYDLVRTYIMALKGFKRDAAAWLLSSPGIFFIITSAFFLDGYLKLYPIVAILIYAFLPSAVIIALLPKLFRISSGEKIKVNWFETIVISLFAIPYLLISNIGPWITVKHKTMVMFGQKKPEKKKTER